MIIFAIVGVSLSLMLGLSSVITWEITTGLITVSIGIPSLILTYEKVKSEVSVKPKKRRKEKEDFVTEEKDILREETIHVIPRNGYSYDLELKRNEHLKGEIVSTSHIDIYFVDERNFKKWEKNKNFSFEDCNESVLEAKIDYLVPKKGTWHLIIENNGRKSARVKVCLY